MPERAKHAVTLNGRPKLLLVDDDESTRITLAMALRREGYDVRVAEDGDTALRMLSQEHYNWVVSDVRMPGMTGIELASKINVMFRGVRCILISAYAMAEELSELGVVACLEKPVDSERLFSLLHANGDTSASSPSAA